MKYYNLLILFMITLKCRAAEVSATITYSTVEKYSNTEALSVSTTEGKLLNINSSSEPNESTNTPIDYSDNNAVDVKDTEDGISISRRLVQQGTRIVKNIGSSIKGIAQLKETHSKDDEGPEDRSQNTVINTTSNVTDDNEEKKKDPKATSVNCSTNENVNNREVSNASLTEASENAPVEPTQLPNINGSSEGSVAEYSTNANTDSPLMNEKFAAENIINKWTQLPNFNSPSETPVMENTLTKATVVNSISLFTNKEFGKLPIRTKPWQRTRSVTSIIGSLVEGLAQLNEPVSEEDEGASDKEQASAKNFTVTNVTKSEVFNAINTEVPENIVDKWTLLPNINSLSEVPVIQNTLINATLFNGVSPFKNKVFGKLPIPKKPRKRTRNVVKIIGSLMEGLARLNEPYSEEKAVEDNEGTTIVNFASIQNVTSSEVFKPSTTKAPDNIVNEWTQLPKNYISSEVDGVKNTLNNATVINADMPFKNKEIGKLPIPNKPRQRTRKEVKIIGSLMEGLARLYEPDSNEDAGADNEVTTVTTVCGSNVDNVTNSEINAITTEAPNNLVDKWTLLTNTDSLNEPTVPYENTLIHATNAKVRNPFKKEIGKLPIPIRPHQGSHLMGNIIESFVKGLVQGTDANKDKV